jgi:hypothetical protein
VSGSHAVTLRGREYVELDAAHEQRVGQLFCAEALEVPSRAARRASTICLAENEEEPT